MSSYLIYEKIFIPSIYCFVFIYLIRFIIVIRGEDWFLIWMGLEINIISFLILIYKRYRVIIGESCLKYFFIQRIRSSLFISLFYLNYYLIGGVIIIILRLKIGAGPFFFWFPSLCSGLDWFSCYILMLFQKVLPLMLIFMFIHWIIWIIVIVRLLLGVIGSFNQSNIKQLLAYSSIHHLGWIVMVGILKRIRWMLYLIVYGLVLYRIVILLLNDNIVDLSLLFLSKYKIIFLIGILSIGGVPPLLGFFLKWIALINIFGVSNIYLFMLIVVSVLILYVYIRIIYDVMLGGRIEWTRRWIYYYYVDNVEIIRILGIIIGVVLIMFFYYKLRIRVC